MPNLYLIRMKQFNLKDLLTVLMKLRGASVLLITRVEAVHLFLQQ